VFFPIERTNRVNYWNWQPADEFLMAVLSQQRRIMPWKLNFGQGAWCPANKTIRIQQVEPAQKWGTGLWRCRATGRRSSLFSSTSLAQCWEDSKCLPVLFRCKWYASRCSIMWLVFVTRSGEVLNDAGCLWCHRHQNVAAAANHGNNARNS